MGRSLVRLALGIAIGSALYLSLPIAEGQAAAIAAKDNSKAKQARQFYKEGQYEEAARIFSSLSTEYPDNLVFTRNLGACYYYLHRPDPALSNLREYLRRGEDLTPQDRSEVEGWIAEMENLRRQTTAAATPQPTASAAHVAPAPAPVPVLAPTPAPVLSATAQPAVNYAAPAAAATPTAYPPPRPPTAPSAAPMVPFAPRPARELNLTDEQIQRFSDITGDEESVVRMRLSSNPRLVPLAAAAADARAKRKSTGKILTITGGALLAVGFVVGVALIVASPEYATNNTNYDSNNQPSNEAMAGTLVMLGGAAVGLALGIPGVLKLARFSDEEREAVDAYSPNARDLGLQSPPHRMIGKTVAIRLWSVTF
jgi:cell division septation protein DedD